MEQFIDLNRQTIIDKLSTIDVQSDAYRADALIECISQQKVRDLRLISDYKQDELITVQVKTKGYTRMVRYLTMKGVERYLKEGKVFCYKNACEFFKIKPINLEYEKYKKELSIIQTIDRTQYDTKKILKWLYDKRKSIRQLSAYTTLENLVNWIDTNESDYNLEKFKYLKTLL